MAGINSTCFLCSENIFQGDPQITEIGGNGNTSYGVNSSIKTEGGYRASEQIPFRGICRYLGIDFQQFLTRDADKLPEDELPDLSVAVCKQCSSIVSPLSTLCNQLDLLQMKVNYYLKSVIAVAERLSGDKATKNSIDERNQKLRIEISKKGKAKLNQAIPKVGLIKNSTEPLSNIIFDAVPLSVKSRNADNEKDIFHHVRKPKERKCARKELECNVCGKRFNFTSNYYSHRKLGHNEQGKPNVIKCKVCGKIFQTREGLKIHIKWKHHQFMDDDVKCDVCGRHLSHPSALRRHKKTVHKSDVSQGQETEEVNSEKANLNSKEGDPDVKVEHPVDWSEEGMHLNSSTDRDGVEEEEDQFCDEYVNPSGSTRRYDHDDDCYADELQVEMKIVPD